MERIGQALAAKITDVCHYRRGAPRAYGRHMIWRGPTFEPDRTLVDDEILHAADRHAAKPAITDARSGRTLTFGQLADGIRRLAAGLAEQGVGRGDVVAIAAANGPDYAVALYGALAAGATVASANPLLKAPELAHLLGIAKPRLVYTDFHSQAAVSEAGAFAVRSLDSLDELLAAPPAHVPSGRDPDDVALLFPSSGTTGLPKLAMHTHAGTTRVHAGHARPRRRRSQPDDVVADVIPFAHLFGDGDPDARAPQRRVRRDAADVRARAVPADARRLRRDRGARDAAAGRSAARGIRWSTG